MDEINNIQSAETVKRNNAGQGKVPIKKVLIYTAIGLIAGLILAGSIYFFFFRSKEDSEVIEDESGGDSDEVSVEVISPADLEYNGFNEAEDRFSFQYPASTLRMNEGDINSSIPQESKDRFGTEVLFVGILQENQAVVQISAYSYQYDEDKSLSDIFDELIEFSNERGISYEITYKQISESEMEFNIDYVIEGIICKSQEKIMFETPKDGIKTAYSVSVLITESIYEKYAEVAKYIVDSAELHGLSQEDELRSNTDLINDIYLGRYPKGSDSPTDGSGITETNIFSRENDLLCLVTDLTEAASGFSIEVYEKDGVELITSEYNVTLDKGISSGCNGISFETGEYLLRISRSNEVVEQVEFEVN